MPQYTVNVTRVADPRDIELGLDLVRKHRQSGMSLSAYLEAVNPSTDAEGPDAYERQLARMNIRVADDPVRGIPASSIQDFYTPTGFDGAPLRSEDWMGDKRFFASSQPQSWALFPEYINRMLRATPLAEDVLSELVATVTTIDTNTYQSVYFQDSTVNRQLSMVPEGAALPKIFVRVGEQVVTLGKYGAEIVGTYEFARRIKLPIFNIYLARIRQQIRLDLSAQAADVLVNGDGNSNAATNYNVSTLDPSATAGPGTVTDPYLARIGAGNATSSIAKNLTYMSFLTWRTSLYALGMTTIVGRMNEIIQVLQLQMPTINPTLLLGLIGGGDLSLGYGKLNLPQTDLFGAARLVYLPFAPGGLLIGLNKEFALEMLQEAGSDLTETDKDIHEQKNSLTISQTNGFDRIIASAASTLTFA